MQITLAKTAGFCFGVNRAVNMLYDLVAEGVNVCTLGPIIHNPQVIEDLQNRGVNIIENIEEAINDKKLLSALTVLNVIFLNIAKKIILITLMQLVLS